MSQEAADAPIVNDAITSDDAGFSSNAGDQVVEESYQEESAEQSEDQGSEEVTVEAESVEELQDEIEEAIEEGASEEEVKDMIKEFTIKVNGKEKQVKFDLGNEAEIIKKLQLAEASQVAMQEKREMEKSYEQEVRNLLENPFEVLQELGLDPLKLAEDRIKSEVEERKKSPEVRERERIEKELAQARAELKQRSEEAESAKMQQLEEQATTQLNNEIQTALDAHPNLPNTEGTIAKISETMLWAYENADKLGINPDDIKVEDVIPTVEKEIREEIRQLLGQLPEDGIEELIGQQTLEKMRKKRLSTAQTNNVNNVKSTTQSVKPSKENAEKIREKAKNYFRNL